MPTIINRSPFQVVPKGKQHSKKTCSFRGKNPAEEYRAKLESQGFPCSVKQAPTGAWDAIVRLVDTEGKKHSETHRFDTEKEARTWADAEETKLKGLRKIGAPVSAAKTPFGKAVDEWYEKRGMKLNGAKIIGYNIPTVKENIGEDRPLDEVSVAVLRNWRDRMKAEGYAASTVANHRQIISGTFKYWISEKDFPGDNPVKAITWEKPDNVSKPPVLSDKKKGGEEKSEEVRLLDAIRVKSPWLAPVVEWAMETAMRRGEIVRMDWAHVDLDAAELAIPKTKSDWRKKNTDEKGREIPLWPTLIAILDRHFPDKAKRKGKVFEGTESSYTHSFKERAKEAGMGHLSFHSLRKIGTARLSKKLPNVVELSKITDHRDLATLARRYYGVELADLAGKIARADKMRDED